MRWEGPAVQAAKPPAPATLARRILTTRAGAGQRRAIGSGPRRKVSSSTGESLDFRGPLRSKPINTARGTPWELADLRRALPQALQKAGGRHIRHRHASLPRGKRGPWVHEDPGVPRALGWAAKSIRRRACRGLAKQYGGWRTPVLRLHLARAWPALAPRLPCWSCAFPAVLLSCPAVLFVFPRRHLSWR
jgi:hypothetical protein